MATPSTPFRLDALDLGKLDAIARHESRRRSGNITHTVSRAEAVRIAIREAHEARRVDMEADQAAWDGLVHTAGERAVARLGRTLDDPARDELIWHNGITAILTLRGEGKGDPIPEDRRPITTPDGRSADSITPARWAEMDVTASLDNEPVDLPLTIKTDHLSLEVYLTDAAGRAHFYIGTLSRVVEHARPALDDRRLYSLARDLGFED